MVATACTSNPPPPEPAERPGPAPGVAFDPCDGQGTSLPASPAGPVFEAGGSVDSVILEDLGLKRGEVKLEARLVGREVEPARSLAPTAALQGRLLDAPTWAQSTVSDLAGHVRKGCTVASGEVMAGLVADLELRNRTGSQTSGDRATIDDLAAGGKSDDALFAAFREVFAVRTPWPRRPTSASFEESEPAIRALATALDPATQQALAAVVVGMARAEEWRLAALRGWYTGEVDHAEIDRYFSTRSVPGPLVPRFDHAAMAQAGAALALAVERLEVHLAAHPLPSSLESSLVTPLGQVVLRGGSTSDGLSFEAPAVVIDQGGDDTYRGVIAAPAMASVPLSVLIDLGGNDRYMAEGASVTRGPGRRFAARRGRRRRL